MIQQNVSLKPYNTFGINVNAESFASVKTLEDLNKFVKGFSRNMQATISHLNDRIIALEKEVSELKISK